MVQYFFCVLLYMKVQVGAEGPNLQNELGTVAYLRDKYHGYFNPIFF